MDTGDSNTTDARIPQGSLTYVLRISLALIFLIIAVFYISYKCKRTISFPSPPDEEDNANQPIRVPGGVDDEILINLPAFVYSDDMMSHKGDTNVENTNGSGCSICLVDYKPAVLIRSLPECGHLFHRKCIDTWLRVHPTCPMCRNSPFAGDGLSVDSTELSDQTYVM